MATIIRAADAHSQTTPTVLRFEDLAEQLISEARSETESIRRNAAEEGCRAAMEEVERKYEQRVAPALEALEQAAEQLNQSKQAWLAHWEEAAVKLSAAMAARVVRDELSRRPEITLTLIREALELAAGSPDVRLHINPLDCQALGEEISEAAKTLPALGDMNVEPDESIQRGECRVETRFGSIDQRIESQLNRIVEELNG